MYKCETCKYTSKDKSNYTRHIKTVCNIRNVTIGDKPFSILNDKQVHCVVCDKCMLRSSAKKHACRGAPKNTCKFCRKTFKHHQSVSVHHKICKQRMDNQPTEPKDEREEDHGELKEVYRIAAEERDRFCSSNGVDEKRVFCEDGSNITIEMCKALRAQLHDAFKRHGLSYELTSTTKPSLVVAYIKSGFTGYEPSLEFIKIV